MFSFQSSYEDNNHHEPAEECSAHSWEGVQTPCYYGRRCLLRIRKHQSAYDKNDIFWSSSDFSNVVLSVDLGGVLASK